jgi:hypothetical protein
LVKTVKTVNLAARFFMVVADLPAKLPEVLQAELHANLPAGFSWSRHPSHFLMNVAQTSFASARNSGRYESSCASRFPLKLTLRSLKLRNNVHANIIVIS